MGQRGGYANRRAGGGLIKWRHQLVIDVSGCDVVERGCGLLATGLQTMNSCYAQSSLVRSRIRPTWRLAAVTLPANF